MKKQYRDFESAREFVRGLKFNSVKEWREYCRSGNRPDNISSNSNLIYKNKGWNGWGDFLGTGTVATKLKKYRPFAEAREFVRALNLKGYKEWQEYCVSGNKPDDIHTNPRVFYKNNWNSIGDWLGTGTVSSKNKQFHPFAEAREFVRSLGLKSNKEWREYCRSGNRPNDIPNGADKVYKKDWQGWGNFLGTETIAAKNKQYLTFTEAREFTRKLKLKGARAWYEYCRSGDKPDDIPATPSRHYKGKGWMGWGDWTGTGIIATYNIQYSSFTESREFVQKLGLKNQKEWFKYSKSGSKPENIPASPQKVYKKDWQGWGNFLGTGNVRLADKQYRSFKEAREFVQKLGLKNNSEWKQYCKSGSKPDDIPAHPWDVYKEWNIKRREEKK
jgi:hypothetical protein